MISDFQLLLIGLAFPILLTAIFVVAQWIFSPSRSEREALREQRKQFQQRFRQARNKAAEKVMATRLKELNWPEAAMQMTPEEIAHQLCNRLAVQLWNLPNVDEHPTFRS